MKIEMTPIGTVHTESKEIPRFWSDSDVEGTLVIDDRYLKGMQDIKTNEQIIVLFYFHKSTPFSPDRLTQHPRGDLSRKKTGVFSISSPVRPNHIGMSIVEVTGITDNVISVKGLDMIDGTPILDIKPYRF
jgi:tRNA-Thr(GGU) m(6)t(6)A37 methyltransferase TsaA